MALNNENKSLVQFGYGFNEVTSKTAGMISFDSSAQAIYVGDGEKANLVTSSVKDAVLNDSILTITKVSGDNITLNFKDVASAKETLKIFAELDTRISNLSTNIDASISALDASYKAADTALSERIAKFETGDNSVATQITTAIDALDSSKEAEDSSKFVKVKVDIVNGKLSENGVVVTTTDIASANALAEVEATANAAAKQTDFNAHSTDNDIHITAQERIDWNAAKTAIDTFLEDASLTGEVIDTLTEIQDYIASDASAADKLVKDLSDVSTRAEKGITDAATAQADVDALEGTVETLSTNFNTHSNNNDIHVTTADKAKWNAAEQNAKNYADSLASNYDEAGAASTAESNAKTYADAIKVNGQTQSDQEITLAGANILVGGSGSHKTSNIDTAIEDLYAQVGTAMAAGVQSLVIDGESSNYAEVDASTGAVSFKIKTVDVSTASTTSTGLADAYKTQQYVSFRINNVIGTASDASDANTVYGAKKYAEELNTAMDARMDVVEAQLKWNVLA